MKAKLCVLIVGVAMWTHVQAAITLVEWDGLAGSSQLATSSDANIVASGLTRGSGLVEATGTTFNSRAWTQGGSFSDAVSAGDYLTFSLTIQNGFQLNDVFLTAAFDRSSTGPANLAWGYDLNGGDNFVQLGSDIVTPDPVAVSNSMSLTGPLSGNVSFAVVGWNATGSTGTMDIENGQLGAGDVGLRFSGVITAVPEPSSTLLLGMGGLALLSRRKRTHRIRMLPNR